MRYTTIKYKNIVETLVKDYLSKNHSISEVEQLMSNKNEAERLERVKVINDSIREIRKLIGA